MLRQPAHRAVPGGRPGGLTRDRTARLRLATTFVLPKNAPRVESEGYASPKRDDSG